MVNNRRTKLKKLEAYYRVQFLLQARLRALLLASTSEEVADSPATFLGKKRFAARAYRISCRHAVPISCKDSAELLDSRTRLQRTLHRGLGGDPNSCGGLVSLRQQIFSSESDLIARELELAAQPRGGAHTRQIERSLIDLRKELLSLVSAAGTESCFVFRTARCSGAGQDYVRDTKLPFPELAGVGFSRLRAVGFPKYPGFVVGPKADFARGQYACAMDVKLLVCGCERSLISLKRSAQRQLDQDIARIHKVPPLQTGRFLAEPLTSTQKKFLDHLYEDFQKGNAPDICGQYSYAYLCLQRLILDAPELARKFMATLVMAYVNKNTTTRKYLLGLLSDHEVVIGEYGAARDTLRKLPFTVAVGPNADAVLSLDLIVSGSASAQGLILLGTSAMTDWGHRHRSQVAVHVEEIVKNTDQKKGQTLLAEWTAGLPPQDYFVLSGSMIAERIIDWERSMSTDIDGEISIKEKISKRGVKAPIHGYRFSASKAIIRAAEAIVRNAENAARVAQGHPKIGEGWVSETELYHALREVFSTIEMIPHAKPVWLGRQHLDIFMPTIRVAVEYQGAQHDRPIDYFGGNTAFEKVQQLDSRKQKLCAENHVTVVYVRPNYILEEVIQRITSAGNIAEGILPDQRAQS